jgi:hypothetical protein
MTPSAANNFYSLTILPQDYKRYAVVSWNDNLTGFTEAELYTSLAYSQQTFSIIVYTTWLKNAGDLMIPVSNVKW